VRTDAEPTLAADEHSFDTIFETCNNVALSEREGRFFSLANLIAVVQEKLIANGDRVAAASDLAAVSPGVSLSISMPFRISSIILAIVQLQVERKFAADQGDEGQPGPKRKAIANEGADRER
jgi:hypothetical protein